MNRAEFDSRLRLGEKFPDHNLWTTASTGRAHIVLGMMGRALCGLDLSNHLASLRLHPDDIETLRAERVCKTCIACYDGPLA